MSLTAFSSCKCNNHRHTQIKMIKFYCINLLNSFNGIKGSGFFFFPKTLSKRQQQQSVTSQVFNFSSALEHFHAIRKADLVEKANQGYLWRNVFFPDRVCTTKVDGYSMPAMGILQFLSPFSVQLYAQGSWMGS